jgi:hypothetical protein
VVLILTGCASGPAYEINKSHPISSFPKEYGVIVGSFPEGTVKVKGWLGASERNPGYKRSFHFRDTVTLESRSIYSAAPEYFYAYALPPGEYEFFSHSIRAADVNDYSSLMAVVVSAAVNESGILGEWSNVEKIPFKVESGKVHYLGEIKCLPVYEENLFKSQPAGGSFVLSDQSATDIPALKAKFPDLNWAALEITPLKRTIQNLPPTDVFPQSENLPPLGVFPR